MKSRYAILATFLAPIIAVTCSSVGAGAATPAEALKLLRSGGYTVYFRHAPTDFSQSDTSDRADCAQQRNLSQAGRELARAIGAAIAALHVPVDEVRAGPLCRTMDSARLMFGRAISDPDVRGGGLGKSDYPGLRWLLARAVPAGVNYVLVGHGHQFQSVAGGAELGEGDAAVVKRAGDDRFETIATIRAADWAALARADHGSLGANRTAVQQ